MGPPPLGLPNPFGGAAPSDPSKPDAFGKTRYHYKTLDGGPPLDGRVPTAPLGFGGIPSGPTMPCLGRPGAGGLNPYGMMQSTPLGPPPAYSAGLAGHGCTPGYVPVSPNSSQEGPLCVPAGSFRPMAYRVPIPPRPGSTSQGLSNSSGSGSFATAPARDQGEPPMSGNRVKGQLISLKDGTGVIMPRETAIVHVFTENLVNKYPPKSEHPNMIYIPPRAKKNFTAQHVPCNMTLQEFILQIDCKKRANTHFPYSQPGQEYPEDLIGFQELVDLDNGWFALGEKICLGDTKAQSKVRELFNTLQGEAGYEKPRYVVRFPV